MRASDDARAGATRAPDRASMWAAAGTANAASTSLGSALDAALFCSARSSASPAASRWRACTWLPIPPRTSGAARPSSDFMADRFTPDAAAVASVSWPIRTPKIRSSSSPPSCISSSPLPVPSRSVMLPIGPRRPASSMMRSNRPAPGTDASCPSPATIAGIAVSSALRVPAGFSPTSALARSMTSGVR
ncbi:MAG: hypothetical protein QM820_42395 [Minicystis sp.]